MSLEERRKCLWALRDRRTTMLKTRLFQKLIGSILFSKSEFAQNVYNTVAIIKGLPAESLVSHLSCAYECQKITEDIHFLFPPGRQVSEIDTHGLHYLSYMRACLMITSAFLAVHPVVFGTIEEAAFLAQSVDSAWLLVSDVLTRFGDLSRAHMFQPVHMFSIITMFREQMQKLPRDEQTPENINNECFDACTNILSRKGRASRRKNGQTPQKEVSKTAVVVDEAS